MTNKIKIKLKLHASLQQDLSSNHPAIVQLMEFLGEAAAEIDYHKQIQLKNESIREEGRHE